MPRAAKREPSADTRHIEMRATNSLRAYAKNPRSHSDLQIQQLTRSLQEFGWTNPILIGNDDSVVAGHGRMLAAQQLGMAEVPTIRLSSLTPAQLKAYRLADNQLALNAGWDDALLRLEIGDLKDAAFDLSLLGFSDESLADLLAERTEGLTDPDDVPDAPEYPVSRTGDLWVLGRHRLLCGDSTVASDVECLMAGREADLCFTSPPYDQQRDFETGPQNWDLLMRGVFSVLPMKPDAQVLVNLGLVHDAGEWRPYWDGWIEWMRTAGWRRFGWYVWDKLAGLPGDWQGRLAPSHEFIFHFNRISVRANKIVEKDPKSIEYNSHGSGLRTKNGRMSGVSNRAASLQPMKIPDSVLRIVPHKARGGVENEHPAIFPVDLVSEIINAFSCYDDVVYEPFCGSGTQLIAAQKNGRSCFALEISPYYCDITVERFQKFSGQLAKLECDGRSFQEITQERLAKAEAV